MIPVRLVIGANSSFRSFDLFDRRRRSLPLLGAMHSSIRPNHFVVVQLPSDQTRIVKLVPNTYV